MAKNVRDIQNEAAAVLDNISATSAQVREYLASGTSKIQVQISSFAEGLQVIRDVSIVRVRGRESRLLIMEDYMPIIGEVDGAIDVIGKDFFETFEPIQGFFCHEHNVFFLLLREQQTRGDGKLLVSREKEEPIGSATIEAVASLERD
ncbi:MAG: hypothetical protein LBH64_01365 [Coriobacteriales bacterium]|jgi:hypothetical protein|nr:hypothetical protein [Coriobacteriales bacterium]